MRRKKKETVNQMRRARSEVIALAQRAASRGDARAARALIQSFVGDDPIAAIEIQSRIRGKGFTR